MALIDDKRQDQQRAGWLPTAAIAEAFGVSERWVRRLIDGNHVENRLVKLAQENQRGLRFVSIKSLNEFIANAEQSTPTEDQD